MANKLDIKVARVYGEPATGSGARVLVDRLWPRGLSKEQAHLDEWCTQVAPSPALRKWYAHDPDRFEEFARRYRAELEEPERVEAVRHLRERAEHGTLVLLTATKDARISEAVVLADVLRD